MVGLINGNNGVATTVYKYGAGSGDYTSGIAGITATAVDDGGQFFITITANKDGAAGNGTIFTDVAGTMIAGGGAGSSPARLFGGRGVSFRASFHKTQRNTRKYLYHSDIFQTVATRSVYDNFNVQHQIPQSDMQYSWITASATNVIYGFQQPNYQNASLGSTDITFATASDFGAFINTSLLANGKYIMGRPYYAAGPFFLPQDFVGLNNFSYLDADQMDLNTISYIANEDLVGGSTSGLPASDIVESLNLNLLKGNGPYGQSSWKQI